MAGNSFGTLFRFTVAMPVLHQVLAEVPRERPILGYGGRRRLILIADDHDENRQLLRQMLEPVGFDVELASDGGEALARAAARGPDLVVMDLRMPGVNGFGAAEQIRALPGLAGVPVIAASASSADLERAQADPSFALCLRKPFQAVELLDAIEHLLGLSWRYGEEGATGGDDPAGPLQLPPVAVLEELLDAARLGKLVRVEQRVLELERSDPGYAAFTRKVHALARGFEEERLIALLQGWLGTQRDVVGQR